MRGEAGAAHLRGRLPRGRGRLRDRGGAPGGAPRQHRGDLPVQDRHPPDPLQHPGHLRRLRDRAVRLRQLAQAAGLLPGAQRHHGEAARRERVPRGHWRHRQRGRAHKR